MPTADRKRLVTDSPDAASKMPGRNVSAPWRWPALVMFAVGYGANQCVPLLAVYRRTLALSDAQATAVFGVYALGLIPGLLLAGPASDRHGRRRLMIAFAGLSLLTTAVLITGRWGAPGLYAGRLLTGVVSGGAFSVGTAWIKELSDDAPPGAGARRGALALTAGFAVGPLVAGPLAQWAPEPELLPYLLHLLLAAVALVLLPRAPETVPPTWAGRRAASPGRVRSAKPLGSPGSWCRWPRGCRQHDTGLHHAAWPRSGTGLGPDRCSPGMLAALALGAGIAVQPLGRRLQNASVKRGTADAAATGLALVTGGCLAGAAATAHPGVPAATISALLLGAGYGLCILSGLREVEHLAPTGDLGSLVSVSYSLAYAGLALPYLLALAAPHFGYPAALLLTALAAALTLLLVGVQGRRHPAPTGH